MKRGKILSQFHPTDDSNKAALQISEMEATVVLFG
jgi:hypothetical protein